jgi:serine/threonine protein kinase
MYLTYFIGGIRYSLVAGKLPFDGRDKTEQVYNILNQKLKFPSRIRCEPLQAIFNKFPARFPMIFSSSLHSFIFDIVHLISDMTRRDADLMDLLSRMLERSPRRRITVGDAMRHPWVQPARGKGSKKH